MSLLFQALCTCVVGGLCLNMGLLFAWPSSTINLFESPNTPLHRPMTETEVALLGSLSSIGAMIGTPCAGYFLDKIGRKYSTILAASTYVVAWGLIAAFDRVEVILLAVFLSGLGAAAGLVSRIYVSEICQESIRGAMTTGTMVFYATGMLVSYLIGGCLEYRTMVLIGLAVASVGAIMIGVLKESPTVLLKKGLEEEAVKSFAFYRRASLGSKMVRCEMETLRRAFNPDLDMEPDREISPEEEKFEATPHSENLPKEKLSLWNFLRKSRSTRRAMLVTFLLATANGLQGLVVVQVYARPLFLEAIPNMSATLCSVLLAVVTVISGIAAGYLMDIAGRRSLMIYSSIGAGMCCVVLGTQLHLQWAPHFYTAVFIYLFCATYTCGAGVVPFVLVTDVFLPEVRSIMSMLVIEWAWLCCFVILFIINPLTTAVGLGPVFYMFAAICFMTAIFSAIFQPETKGLPVDVVQRLFVKKRGISFEIK